MKKFFLALLFFGVMGLQFKVLGEDPIANRLVFLNFPERVIEPGKLASETIKKSSNTRIFFHYLNSTGRDQVFQIKFEGNFEDFKIGYATDKEPKFAGSQAVNSFLKFKEKKTESPKFNINLPHNETISGIIEATMSPMNKWEINLGKGDLVDDVKILSTEKYEFENLIYLQDSKTFTYRMGDNPKDLIPGHYGYNYNFKIVNKTENTKKLVCYIDPRGGDFVGVFEIDKMIITTDIIEPRITKKIYDKYLNPGDSIEMNYIPTGGCHYPVEFKFKLI